MLGYENGGGIFGPPIRGWHKRADVAVATAAAGPRQRNAVEIAYGKIEANARPRLTRSASSAGVGVAAAKAHISPYEALARR